MRGARHFRPDVPSRVLKCAEKLLPGCDSDTEQCCKVVPCEYCLLFVSDGYLDEKGIASGSTTWSGSIAGAAFLAKWEKTYGDGVCWFVVTLNGIEISRSDCNHTTCRDSSAHASVTVGGHAGVLTWTKRLFHPLQYVTDGNTNCKTHFCGDCECTCETLCVEVAEPPPDPEYPNSNVRLDPYSCDGLLPLDCGFCDTAPDGSITRGELPNTEDDGCKRPIWSNTVAGRSITLMLSRGIYGECLLSGTIAGESVGPTEVGDCKSISGSWTLTDGTQVSVTCKDCACDEDTPTDEQFCCDLVPCAFCVQYEEYGKDPLRVYTEHGSGQWGGSFGTNAFLMYWQINSYGECEFVVEWNGEVVYRKSVSEGASCEDVAGEVMIGDDRLSWTIVPMTPLKRQDENTPFCGSCDCVSECFCITITEPPDRIGSVTYRGPLCNSAYECEAPVWEGAIGPHSVSITLAADRVIGACVLGIVVDGETFDAEIVTCDDIDITLELYDGTLVEIVSQQCECEYPPSLCCGGRNLADTLYLRFIPGTASLTPCPDSYITLTDDGTGNWYGSGSVEVEIPDGGGETCVVLDATFHFYCDPGGPVYLLEWYFTYLSTRYPTTGWESIDRASDDCDYPYLGSFDETTGGGVGFWNGKFTTIVSEVPV